MGQILTKTEEDQVECSDRPCCNLMRELSAGCVPAHSASTGLTSRARPNFPYLPALFHPFHARAFVRSCRLLLDRERVDHVFSARIIATPCQYRAVRDFLEAKKTESHTLSLLLKSDCTTLKAGLLKRSVSEAPIAGALDDQHTGETRQVNRTLAC